MMVWGRGDLHHSMNIHKSWIEMLHNAFVTRITIQILFMQLVCPCVIYVLVDKIYSDEECEGFQQPNDTLFCIIPCHRFD